jgi:NAD-dependent deacetylase
MEGFKRDPELVWEWYRERRALVRASEPNAAHVAVVQLAHSVPRFLLLTQNVDDLHTRARWYGRALDPASVVQIHGDLFVTRCTTCDFSRPESDADAAGVPRCPKCGSPLRPGVVWFDEELNADDEKRVEDFMAEGACDVVLAVGTTAQFDYIVNWAVAAKGDTGQLIEVNPTESALSEHATRIVREPAAIALPALVEDLVRPLRT